MGKSEKGPTFWVLPSSSGSSSSGAVAGQVTGISNWRSNSYLRRLWTYQHFPVQRVPSGLAAEIRNQSLSLDLFIWVQAIKALYSSFSLCVHAAPSLGPAFVVNSGIWVSVDFVFGSQPSIFIPFFLTNKTLTPNLISFLFVPVKKLASLCFSGKGFSDLSMN